MRTIGNHLNVIFDCFESLVDLIETVPLTEQEKAGYECEGYFNIIALRMLESYFRSKLPALTKMKWRNRQGRVSLLSHLR